MHDMNRQNRGFQGVVLEGGKTAPEESADYREMINQHLPLIERQCFKVVRQQLKTAGYGNPGLNNPVNIENEALELSGQVLDTLQKDDYRVLRQFKGNSKLSTYLTTIVARHAVDMVRKKRGRGREKERAQAFGETGLMVYELVMVQGCGCGEAHARLQNEHGVQVPLEEIEAMVDKIKGKRPDQPTGPVVKEAMPGKEGDKDAFIIADTSAEPAGQMEEEERMEMVDDVVKGIIRDLNGEERLILRMRFPTGSGDDKKPAKVAAIAKALGITEKATYKRITRILKKCRAILEQKGVAVDDLL
jgi:RNA polymerase sigma factor (sigma-70 family)